MSDQFDVVVIGAGPAGYVAAIRCAQLGLRTACIDNWRNEQSRATLGGTCLSVGCIPSKALLELSEHFVQVRDDYGSFGIKANRVELDLAAMMAHKRKVVGELTRGIEGLFKSNDVTWLQGQGRLLSNKRVEFTKHAAANNQTIEAKHIILASGSSPMEIGEASLTENLIVDSTGALAFDEVPKRLGVIGAGVIGLELGSVWRRLGSEVILLEAQESFLSMADAQVTKEAFKEFVSQGLDIRLGARVRGSKVENSRVIVEYQDKQGDHQETVDRLIVAVGRRPNTQGLYASDSQLLLDEWGFVHVDQQCRSNLPGVYAIGDLVRGPMLAHKGSEEGVMVAELIAGHHAEVNYEAVPSVIYTLPEIAWVGKTEQALKAAGTRYHSGTFPFTANGRARAMGVKSGLIKILADDETDRVLGVHMMGPHCSELIALGVMAMQFGASSEDIALTMFAHPTLSEAFHEAALSAAGRPLHIARSKKK